jgi:hypothetical protein
MYILHLYCNVRVLNIIEVLGTIMIVASFTEIFCMYNVLYLNITTSTTTTKPFSPKQVGVG